MLGKICKIKETVAAIQNPNNWFPGIIVIEKCLSKLNR